MYIVIKLSFDSPHCERRWFSLCHVKENVYQMLPETEFRMGFFDQKGNGIPGLKYGQ